MVNDITPIYCGEIPRELEEGRIYISFEYETASHLCACGCKTRTVTPLGKNGWTLNERDGKVTLRPSIGNFAGENPYHAHYFITANKIDWL